jgi:hypothetical protein
MKITATKTRALKSKRAPKKKRAKRIPKPQWMKLTKTEERLLFNPPTPETWLCPAKNHAEIVGEQINSGSTEKCPMCGNARPKKPKLLWPVYLKVCAKAEIDPGTPGYQVRKIFRRRQEERYALTISRDD